MITEIRTHIATNGGAQSVSSSKGAGVSGHRQRFNPMKAWVYILSCSDDSYYTGSTNNLELHLAQHAAEEGSQWARSRLPIHLAFAQDFPSEHETFLCERQLKGWSRAKKEALVRGDFDALVELSKNSVARQDGSVGQLDAADTHPSTSSG